MGRNGKHRWKFSIHRSSTEKSEPAQTPKEFVCPISGSLMADPVVVSSGQTFERVFVQACRNLGFSPPLSDGSTADLSAVIPNMALKSTVLKWCEASGVELPKAPDYSSAEGIVRTMMAAVAEGGTKSGDGGGVEEKEVKAGVSETELLRGVAEKPPVLISHAATELNHRRPNHYDSSSDESVIVGSPPTPLPLATRPSCFSPSSSSSSSEIVAADEVLTLTRTPNPHSSSSDEEEKIVMKLKNQQEVFEQEEGAILLRKITRTNEEIRVSLCTPRLLLALKPLLSSRYSVLQTNAVASLVNLSLEKPNKVKIVRSGVVPLLIDVLKGGFDESQEHAAGAIFSLALEDDNKTAIGVLGALQPLLHALRSESERTRQDSALALYHLSLVQSNRVKLVKLGAVPTLLTMAAARSGAIAGRVLLTLCNLAACAEGRSAMLDANAVECLVGILREGLDGGFQSGPDSAATRENCVAALYSLSHGSMRFKGLAKEARAAEALREVEEKGSERAKEKAKRMLQVLRGRDVSENAAVAPDLEGFLESGSAASRTGYRLAGAGGGGGGRTSGGAKSTEF